MQTKCDIFEPMSGTIIDLIRHGEPRGGRAYRGHGIDDPLSEKGWAQMWRAIEGGGGISGVSGISGISGVPWQLIVCSPLKRCSEFGVSLGEKHQIPVIIEDRFKEVGFGDWEGRTPQEIQSDNLKQYEAFYTDPVNQRPPGAEPLQQFRDRVTQSFEQMAQKNQGKHILVVTHAGVMRAIITHVLHADSLGMYRLRIDNAGLSRVRFGKNGAVLECVNAVNMAALAPLP